MDLIKRETLRHQQYEFVLVPLDGRCSCLRVQVTKGENRFQETIHVYDFIDIKSLLKCGKKVQDINELSLLFLKLMISVAVSTKKIRIIEVKDVPFNKLINKKEGVEKWVKNDEKDEVKGLMLHVKEDLFIIIPKLLVVPPQRNEQKHAPQLLKQQKIKEIFYGRPLPK